MPFTLAHPAAALPLRAAGVPVTALVVGSMVPDAPLFADRKGYAETHSLTGVVTVDLLLGVAVVSLWWWGARDAMVDLAPDVLRTRLEPRRRPTAREVLLAAPAVALGALSHVVWDSFTHPGRWGTRRIGWLREEHAGLVGTQWAQYTSGVVGLAVVTLAAVAFVRAQPVRPDPPRRVLPAWAWLVLLAVPVVAGARDAADTATHGLLAHGVRGHGQRGRRGRGGPRRRRDRLARHPPAGRWGSRRFRATWGSRRFRAGWGSRRFR